MKCDSLLIEDYVEGFLEANELEKLEAHLQTCKSCQNEYQQLRKEQQTLFAQLNTPIIKHSSQADLIMQLIQTNTKRKKLWHSLKISVISAAVLFLSFGFYYWNRMPSEVAQPIDEPAELIEPNSGDQEVLKTSEQNQKPSLDAPFLDVSIEQVVNDGENMDIEFRVKFNDENQRYYENLYSQMLTRYEYDEFLNPPIDKMEDFFFGEVRINVHFALKNDAGELIAGHRLKEKPLINSSSSGRGTNVLGEMIYSVSVPSYTKSTVLEVFAMEKIVHNLNETQVNPQQPQPFQFENAEYTVDSIEIENNSLHIQISTEGEPKIRPMGWNIVIDNRLVVADRNSSKFDEKRTNNRTIYRAQFNDLQNIPNTFKIVPSTVKITEEIDPIRLKLN